MSGLLVYCLIAFGSGLGPTLLFLPLFSIRGILHFVPICISVGVLAYQLSILSFAHLGAGLTGQSLVLISAFPLLLSMLCLSTFITRQKDDQLYKKHLLAALSLKLKKADYLYLGFTFIFLTFFLWTNQRVYFPFWDHYTYWLIDAKEIFESGHLRTSSRLSNLFWNSSYYPLHATLLFSWYQEPIEQWASFFTILYAFLAGSLAYAVTSSEPISNRESPASSNCAKLFVTLLISVIYYSLAPQMFTYYADMANLFCFSLFFFVLTRKSYGEQTLHKAGILIVSCITLVFIKSPNVYYVLFMIPFWLVYEFLFSRGYFRDLWTQFLNLPKKGFSLLFVGFIATLLASRSYYLNFIWTSYVDSSPIVNLSRMNFDIQSKLQFTDELFNLILTDYSLVIVCLLIVAGMVLRSLSEKQYLEDRTAFFIFMGLLLFPAINIGDYLTTEYSLRSKSLIRYVSITFFVLPMVLSLVWQHNFSKGKAATIFCTLVPCFGTLLMGVSLFYQFPQALEEPNSGKYKDFAFLKDTAYIGEKVLDVVGDESLLLVEDRGDGYFSNMGITTLQMRYFVSKASVGGLYNINSDSFKQSRLEYLKPDYLLITISGQTASEMFSISPDKNYQLLKVLSVNPPKFETVEY